MIGLHLILTVFGWLVLILQISSVWGQASKCVPIYTDKPNAICWGDFPADTVHDCSHKFCYDLNEGTDKCVSPWRKPTIHRERELERIATLAMNQFVTQSSCTMRLKTNRNLKTNLHFFANETECTGLEAFTLSHDSCAVLHLNRKIKGYCIWYHNVCPKVPTDVTVCKRDKGEVIPTDSPRLDRPTSDEPLKKSSLSIEIIIIVAVFANLIILIVVVFIVGFLLKRSRMTNRRDNLTGNNSSKSNRPLPRVPHGDHSKNAIHRISKVDSAEFDKWKDESHYMYLSHESVDTPRYHSVTENDVRKAVESNWDYSYPDMEKVKRFSSNSETTPDKSSYMVLMKDGKAKANEIHEHSEKITNEVIDNPSPCHAKSEQVTETHAHSDVDCTEQHDGIQCIEPKSSAFTDNDDDYSELKVDYYVLEENDSKIESETGGLFNENECTVNSNDGHRPNEEIVTDPEEATNHDYFQLESDDIEEVSRRSPEEVDDQDSIHDEQLCTEGEIVRSELCHSLPNSNL
ncbi:uncharacterized protein LOC117103866 [Anneissia japonica]|uniref:uncharacterized protein LOC117103866 n=1 Tax=Anneissia japonica TaxID=1529436 RepID=UPI0014255CD2|nr:uncharacterized protein LOC117103866 [Anneissia japonica]